MKYKLTDNTKVHNGTTLYQIEALMDFGDVKKDDLGGFVQSEKNLSQEGECWVYDNAKVIDNACVFNDAQVCDNAIVYDNTIVSDNALIYGNAEVRGNACITDASMISGKVWLGGDGHI